MYLGELKTDECTNLEVFIWCLASISCGQETGCFPAPPPICNLHSCPRNYFCAPATGNCVLRSKLLSADVVKKAVKVVKNFKTDDEEFNECCQMAGLPNSCLSKCSYNNYNKANVQRIYLGLDECPANSLAILHSCAAGNDPYINCCIRKQIFPDMLFTKCSVLCRANSKIKMHFDISYLPCFQKFDDVIQECFRNGQPDTESLYRS
ncbi:unnamed protein product [Enterobius vermicularis]|uniref:DB domain-containing protein n=1 Tax=Enterobius vermicularis TaxID=51028 RepID=A0A0N4VLR0_ENTVE|nr:unnamed protein product [Enterobius vermicularis]